MTQKLAVYSVSGFKQIRRESVYILTFIATPFQASPRKQSHLGYLT